MEGDDGPVELGTNECAEAPWYPRVGEPLPASALEGTSRLWTLRVPGAALEKAVGMPREQNASCVRYGQLWGTARYASGSGPT